MNMKILFLNPPFFGSFNREVRFQSVSPQKALHPPIMLAYAASLCREAGHEVDLIDSPALDLDFEGTKKRIEEFRPKYIVMLTSTGSVNSDGKLAQELGKATGAKTIAVGSHATAVPEDTMKRGFDMVARAEYEYTIKEIASGKALKEVQGITYRDSTGKFCNNLDRAKIENLDELPYPARDFLPNEKYYSALYKNPFTFIYSGRGCPNQCTFCAPPQLLSGQKYRLRSVKNVMGELWEIKKKYKLKSVLFNDDTLTVNPSHCTELCDAIINEKLNLPWACYSRVDGIYPELAEKMRKAGCFLVKIGFESGSDAILKNIKKGPLATIERARYAAKTFMDAGIQVHGTFVLGLPGETKETIKKTVEFAKSLDIDFVQFSIAQPYPGTVLYNEMKAKGWLLTEDWDDYLDKEGVIAPIFEYPELKKEDLVKGMHYAYKEYYLRPKYIAKAIRQRLTNMELLKNSWRSGMSLMKFIRS
ncbi:MAG: radical SAM protein [archaeon]